MGGREGEQGGLSQGWSGWMMLDVGDVVRGAFINPCVYEHSRSDILDQRAMVKACTIAQRKVHNLRLTG